MATISEVLTKGYFDDSQTSGQVWAIGGYVGRTFLQWNKFDLNWRLVLTKHGVPYFHMREMQDPHGVYSKWYPSGEHKEELADFFADLARVIDESALTPFSCLVRVKDLERFNTEKKLSLQPYALAAYGCMLLVGQLYQGQPVELTFDHVEKVNSKLAKAQDYADSDRYLGPDGVFDKVVTVGLPEHRTFRDIPALQAADFWTWEYRKSH